LGNRNTKEHEVNGKRATREERMRTKIDPP